MRVLKKLHNYYKPNKIKGLKFSKRLKKGQKKVKTGYFSKIAVQKKLHFLPGQK